MKICIGTRGSKLALAQAGYVRDRLQERYPQHSFEIRVIATKGDRITDRPLASIGGKGLFVREIEEQLLAGEIQLAVHSMKDMPVIPAEGLVFTRTWQREDPRDVLILRERASLWDLPQRAVIGTGSLRRQLLLHRLRPDLRFSGIRGNVDTRLRRMEEQKLDGIVLAAAGLHRLRMQERITQYLSCGQMIPAPAQGALALEIREEDSELRELLDRCAHEESARTVAAEREFLRLCGGDCHMPVAALCEKVSGGIYRLRAMKGTADGERAAFALEEGTDVMELAARAARRCAAALSSGTRAYEEGGTVYLVGAGPGDPGLITVRGWELLQRADCVVYDRLIPAELLKRTKNGCELVYVGKEKHHHVMCQEEINALLVRKAAQYRCVVRLKGGDPFVFGRGGEEALALLENGISVEVVPGVTSAVAGAACAGIPVTHRGVSGGFHVVTAQDRRGELADIDFLAIAESGDTAVFLMGLGRLPEIVRRLQEAGMPAETPVCVISRAACPGQKTCQGTLADIAVRVEREGLTPPALILAGSVVRLRDRLGALGRKRTALSCLVPKIGEQTSVLASLLREQGIDAEELQVGEIVYKGWWKGTVEEMTPDWLVFTSRHGVEGFIRGIASAGIDVRLFAGAKIAVIGERTEEELKRHGLRPDLKPDVAEGGALCALLRKYIRPEDVVWYLKAERTAGTVESSLSHCCRLNCREVYANRPVKGEPRRSAYDAIAFTCASSVRRLADAGLIKADSRLFSIGPVCTAQIKTLGWDSVIQAEHASCESLAGKICKTFRERGDL